MLLSWYIFNLVTISGETEIQKSFETYYGIHQAPYVQYNKFQITWRKASQLKKEFKQLIIILPLTLQLYL